MPSPHAATITVEIPTGRLTLHAQDEKDISALCDVAARANPKRGFLIVSRVLGRHLPTRPDTMRRTMDVLGAMVSDDVQEPIVFLGMAETATALGQGVFAAHRRRWPEAHCAYLQTSRQRVRGAQTIATFEEGHSHATTHLIQVMAAEVATVVRSARTLVIIDDECSTGRTFIACADAMRTAMPLLTSIETCCITDWSNGGYVTGMPVATRRHSVLDGAMKWTPGLTVAATALPAGSNRPGTAPDAGMRTRTGVMEPERAHRDRIEVRVGERILVLGEGEHSYEALLLAEELESAGAIAAVQCITRTPALPGGVMRSASRFTDTYGSGVPCFLYNLLGHAPDRVVIVSEVAGDQIAETRAALAELGADLPVERLECRYGSVS